ncbi:MAG: AGE family epimerase/isomerase [Paracoccaceae bacterium]|nr:AGE family epimerase/isomerase [Paracoccaceae bacterium]
MVNLKTKSISEHDAEYWAKEFWTCIFPDWLETIQDGDHGVFDALDVNGHADTQAGKSVLAQARTLFTVSHIALLSGDPAHVIAARKQAEFLKLFCKSRGLYRCVATREGNPTGRSEDEAARSYDQTFVILGLVTWNAVSPSEKTLNLIEECWEAITTTLTDTKSGLLLNDDLGTNLIPAQNPHMHLYEACLQGYRMTSDAVWLDRAKDFRAKGVRHFMDQKSGSIAEFITPELQPLAGAEGMRREVGHQCEWAWLMLEEADLAKNPALKTTAARLMAFANKSGFAENGLFEGAAFDAVSTDNSVVENSFLLWPQTEAIKIFAVQHTMGDAQVGERARNLMCLMFDQWFEQRPSYVNRLNLEGQTLWAEALTRLMYHVVLAMTEGGKAGLWPSIPNISATQD